ncbi:MAG: hypothetical protein WBK77_04000 [Alphaproteobacteria bacterium]
MPFSFKPARFLVLASPILLAACGDGWEMVRTTDFPYGNLRTAGTGVAYVRAKMLPEKELKIEPQIEAPSGEVPPPPEPAGPAVPVEEQKKAEEVFHKGQEK